MTQEKRSVALTLPDEATFRRELEAVNRFQQVVHANMVKDQDYGVIPGTQKPTLLKPGAEKIAKLLGLADHYTILDQQEDWQKPFFRYLIKCSLVNVLENTTTSEGLGECNSMESKYRWRWVFPDDVPAAMDKLKLVKKVGKRRDGKGTYIQYRLENDDIYSQVNTILKMAKKRALVDAALSAGRLSNIFTQDMEDLAPLPDENKPEAQPNPSLAGTNAKTSPPADDKGDELAEAYREYATQYGGAPPNVTETIPPSVAPPAAGGIDMDWVKETLPKIKWAEGTAISWIESSLLKAKAKGTLGEVLSQLTPSQIKAFAEKLGTLLEVS